MKYYNKFGGSLATFLLLVLFLNIRKSYGQCYTQEDKEQCIMNITCIGSISSTAHLASQCKRPNENDSNISQSYTYLVTIEELPTSYNFLHEKWIEDFRNEFQQKKIKSVVLRNNGFLISPLEGFINFVNIEIINLSNNYLKQFNSNSLLGVSGLVSLDLSHNRISNLIGRHVSSDPPYSSGSTVQRPGEFLEILDLSNNNLKRLEDGVFSTFRSLKSLNLSCNHLRSLNFASLEGLDELQVLNISFNSLKDLNMALFQSYKLEYLDISSNYFITLHKNDFMNTAFLKVFNLQNNSLSSLHPKIFSPHTRLERLNLSQNNFGDSLSKVIFKNNINLRSIDLSFIGMSNLVQNAFLSQNLEVFNIKGNKLSGGLVKEYFNGLSRVTSLDLSHQYITSVGNKTFAGANILKVLDLSYNKIHTLEVKAFVSLVNLTSLDISFNRLVVFNIENVDLISLNILKINHNLLKHINSKTFENLNALEILDMSENEIVYIPTNSLRLVGLRSLNFENNNISKIDSNAFNGLLNIRALDMSYFRLTKILNDTFIGLKNVISLNITNNQIQLIEQFAFRGLVNLTTLDLSNNVLETLAINTSHVPKLIILKLRNNRLLNIETLCNLNNLEFLDLSNNKLNFYGDNLDSLNSLKEVILFNNSFTAYFFISNFSQLIVLDLSMNNIHGLKYSSNTNTNLRKLILSSNKVENITLLNLMNISLLQEIDLSRNYIHDIETTSFEGLMDVTMLDLSFNFVSKLNPGIFSHFQGLQFLNISHNKVKEITFGAFNGLTSLYFLDLSFNEISHITINVLPIYISNCVVLDYNKINTIEDVSVSYNMVFSIGGNPIDCRWLSKWMRNSYGAMFRTLNKNFTGENIDGITCIHKVGITDNFNTHLNTSTNQTFTQYDVRPYFSNLISLLENWLKNNRTLTPRYTDVNSVSFLSNATNLLEKILKKNYTLTVEKSNDKHLKKYYEEIKIQNINIRGVLDFLRSQNNVIASYIGAKIVNQNTSTVKSASISSVELLNKIDKFHSVLGKTKKNFRDDLKGEIRNDFYRSSSTHLDHKERQSNQVISRDKSVSRTASNIFSTETELYKYDSHIKITEFCVVLILIVMLSIIAYKAYLSRILNSRSRMQNQSPTNLEMS